MPKNAPEPLLAFGSAVRELRTRAGLSQEALAHHSGLHRNYIGGIERGERNVALRNLFRLSLALGIKPSRLLQQTEARLDEAG